MEIKVGQKYRIVDTSKMWDREKYNSEGNALIEGKVTRFSDMEIVTVVECPYENNELCLLSNGYSTTISSLNDKVYYGYRPAEEYLKLYEDVEMDDQSDDTISLCHIADVLEDAIENYNWHDDDVENFIVRVQECIKSLRKAGY